MCAVLSSGVMEAVSFGSLHCLWTNIDAKMRKSLMFAGKAFLTFILYLLMKEWLCGFLLFGVRFVWVVRERMLKQVLHTSCMFHT